MTSTTIPGWVGDLVREHRGSDLRFITTKSVTWSDLNQKNQNRFLIPSRDVKVNLIPILSEAETAAASLLQPPARRNMPSTDRVQGREHGGLEVHVYSRSRFRTHLFLTRWDSSGSAVIKGLEYKYFLDRSSLRENDEVELWGFRKGEEGKLCFALGKKIE